MFPTWPLTIVFLLTPGPRMMSGIRIDSSYGRNLSPGIRCSPCSQPLSERNMIIVFSSCPVAFRVLTSFFTWSSTASSEPMRPS